MNTKHTTGQWVALNRTGTGLYKIVSDTLQEICETQMPYGDNLTRPEVFEQGKANAKLIAASPKMIEFIGKVMSKLQEHQKEDKKILAGYTLAANIEGFTDLLNEAAEIWRTTLSWSE